MLMGRRTFSAVLAAAAAVSFLPATRAAAAAPVKAEKIASLVIEAAGG